MRKCSIRAHSANETDIHYNNESFPFLTTDQVKSTLHLSFCIQRTCTPLKFSVQNWFEERQVFCAMTGFPSIPRAHRFGWFSVCFQSSLFPSLFGGSLFPVFVVCIIKSREELGDKTDSKRINSVAFSRD
jgi:hypothetical protein